MVRRTRFSRRLLMCLLPLAVAACGDETIPPATGPAHQTPTTTASALPDPTVTVTTTATPTADRTPLPTPPPTVAATATPEPTPDPERTPIPSPASRAAPLTMSEARSLPVGTALYFRGTAGSGCHGPVYWNRVVARTSGNLLWDDPLAELSPEGKGGDRGAYLFGVSASGQTLAAWACDRGSCDVAEGKPEDAPGSLWVSGDGGKAWERWGGFPTGGISVVTDDDIAVYGDAPQPRAQWFRSGEELEPPVSPLDLYIRGWRTAAGQPEPIWGNPEGTVLVSASGQRLGRPGGFQGAAVLSDGSILWSTPRHGHQEGGDLYLHVDSQGTDAVAYSWDDPAALVIVDHLGEQLFLGFLGDYACGSTVRPVFVDFRTGTVHTIPGIEGSANFVPYAARPAPAPAEAGRPAIEYKPLTMGEPRPLPAGTAVYYLQHHCEGAWDTHRVVASADAGTLVVDRPLAFFDTRPDRSVATVLVGVSESGRTLAARECEQGVCPSMYRGSDDAMYALWVSGDAGATWERWGEMAVEVGILALAEDDVAVFLPASGAGGEAAAGGRAWWYRSGEELPFPQGSGSAEIAMWRPSEAGLTPVWVDRAEGAFLDASGERLATPPPADAAAAEAVWWPVAGLPGGSLLWSASPGGHRAPEEPDLFVTMDEQGEVTGAYSWEDPRRIRLVDHLGDKLFLGLWGMSSYACGADPTTVLVDLGARSVHVVAGLDDVARQWGSPPSIVAARPSPD